VRQRVQKLFNGSIEGFRLLSKDMLYFQISYKKVYIVAKSRRRECLERPKIASPGILAVKTFETEMVLISFFY
jgi:hypothetical protein